MAGKYNNNIGRRISNKTEFLSSYKFSIAMENSNGDGYVSEKINILLDQEQSLFIMEII